MAFSSSTTIGSESKFKDHRESPMERGRRSKRQVGKSRSLDRFQVLLYYIAEGLDKDDLKSMILLCHPHISKRQMGKFEVAEELFAKLCEKDIINDRNTVFLEKLLSHIGKKQLLQRVEAYNRANTTDTDTMTEESESEILIKKRTSKRKRSLDSPDSATPQVQRKSMTKKQKRLTHSKLPDQDDEKFENCWKEKNVGNKRCLDEMMEDDSSDDSRSYWLRPRAGVINPLKDIKLIAGHRQNDTTVQVVGIPILNDKGTPFLQFPVIDQWGTIRSCVAFGHVATNLHLEIEKDSVYTFSKYKVRKPHNVQYNPDPYEILLDEVTEMRNHHSSPVNSFKQLSLQTIAAALKTEERSHVIGKITRKGEVHRISGKVYREIHVVDHSGQEAKVRLGGENAAKFQYQVGQVVQITFVRGTTRDGQSYLVTTVDTEIHQSKVKIQLDRYNPAPKMPRTTLRISSLQELERVSPGTYDIENICKIDAISLRKPYYFGCPNTDCKKKVKPGSNETCVCPRDGYECAPEFYWKILVRLTDHTAGRWVTLFDEHLCGFPTLKKEIRKLPASQRNKIIETALKNANVKVTIKKESESADGNYNLIDIFKMK